MSHEEPAPKRARLSAWLQQWKDRFPRQSEAQPDNVIFVEALEVELRESRISVSEVAARKRDCERSGKRVVWLLDGARGVEISAHRDCGGHLLQFSPAHQTIATFARSDESTVLVDVGEGGVYLVPLRQLRGGCAWVPPPRSQADVVCMIKDISRHDELLKFVAPPAVCRLTVLQDPPGSGKTYRLVRDCLLGLGPNAGLYAHYKLIFVLTKPHSAKEVVLKEFEEQLKEAEANAIVRYVSRDRSKDGKIVRYAFSRAGKAVEVFFATVDCFVYHLAPKHVERESGDMFKNLAKAIKKAGPEVSGDGNGKFRGHDVCFNARALVCWDEATKLERHYLQALAKIMTTCSTDAVLAGDVMQSIEHSDNSLRLGLTLRSDPRTVQDLFPYGTVEPIVGKYVRRFGKQLVEAMNTVVDFQRFGAVKPEAAEDVRRESEGECVVHATPRISFSSDSSVYLETVETIWQQFLCDVVELELLPHELLIVAPLVKVNPVMDELVSRLHEFWSEHLEKPEIRAAALLRATGQDFYRVYDSLDKNEQRPRWLACFHRSEEGRPVDTTRSKWATRAVSIHSSQGDGRRVVYVVTVNETALTCFTRGRRDTLEYESLWTVLMSRAKHRLRLFVERRFDDAWKRLLPLMSEEVRMEVCPTFTVPHRINLERVDIGESCGLGGEEARFQDFQEAVVNPFEARGDFDDPLPSEGIVEDAHHDIRMAIYHYAFVARVLLHEGSSEKKKQFRAVLRNASELRLQPADAKQYYQLLRGSKNKEGFPTLECLPSLKLPGERLESVRANFERYLGDVRKAMKQLLEGKGDAVELDFKGFLVFYHVVDICRNCHHAKTKIDMVYDVVDEVLSAHDENLQRHYADVLERAKSVVDGIVSHQNVCGSACEWKLHHQLPIQTSQALDPQSRPMFICFTEIAAAAVILTPRLDALNIPKIAGQAIAVALAFEHPKGENVRRFKCCARSWLCVAPLTGSAPLWVDIGALLRQTRDVAIDWFVAFLTRACEQHHANAVEFYDWHLKAGRDPQEIADLAEDRRGQKYRESYIRLVFEQMSDRHKHEPPERWQRSAFEKSLAEKLGDVMRKARRHLSLPSEVAADAV